MIAVFKKELTVYFTSALGYVVMAIYLAIAGVVFGLYYMNAQNTSDFSGFFSIMNTTFLFISPILTLRILAEDKKLGTYELLLTSPVSPWSIILGKFLGVFVFAALGATILLVYPLMLVFFTRIEWGAVFSGYLGVLFSLGFFISVGMFASSLTDNFVVAGLISIGLVVFLLMVLYLGEAVTGPVGQFFQNISYSQHFYQFATGLIRLKDVVYFVGGTALWLALAGAVVESKTWK